MRVTDCHVHINPVWEMLPHARALVGQHPRRAEFDGWLEHPDRFLDYLGASGVDRAVLVNYVSPDVVGYSEKVNEWVSRYAAHDPRRLLAVGSVLPSRREPGREVERLVDELHLRALKLHPPHQLFAPNGYLDGSAPGLHEIYEVCERREVPIIFHTGTSVFPRARNRFGQPLLVEDVAIDFPRLTIVLAHGGRPLWMEEAMFLVRRFPNVYLEVSSIPPRRLLEYFPRLASVSGQVLFGTDWPGPGVKDIGENLAEFLSLPLPEEVRRAILEENPERVFPRRPPS